MDTSRHRARQLRRTMTDAELCLWRCLRARQVEGFRFRRQVPIHGYIVDFLCPQARLVVEVDGGQHSLQSGYDAQRTALLQRQGYRVVRYWNHEVLSCVDDVMNDIHRHLTRDFTPPQPVRPGDNDAGRSAQCEPVVREHWSSPPSPAAKGRE